MGRQTKGSFDPKMFLAKVGAGKTILKGFCACQGLRRRGVGMCLAISTPAVLPSVGRKTSTPRTCLTPLNTSPAPSPVNASRLPSRTARAALGAVRYTFTVTDFHRLPFAGLPAHPSTHQLAASFIWLTGWMNLSHNLFALERSEAWPFRSS
jgi:hypothetical protein